MAQFVYTARSKAGQKVDGNVEATDRRAAMKQIEAMGHVPVSVVEGSASSKKTGKGAKTKTKMTWRRGQERMSSREVLMFTQELSDLLASGMTLGNALNTLSNRRTGKAGQSIVTGLRDEIIRGTGMSEAFAKFPDTFTHLYVSMIQAGEASGAMDEVLKRVVEHYERVQDTKEKVGMALTYPLIVLVLGVLGWMFFKPPPVYDLPQLRQKLQERQGRKYILPHQRVRRLWPRGPQQSGLSHHHRNQQL